MKKRDTFKWRNISSECKKINKLYKRHLSNKEVEFLQNFEGTWIKAMKALKHSIKKEIKNDKTGFYKEIIDIYQADEQMDEQSAYDDLLNIELDSYVEFEMWYNPKSKFSILTEKYERLDSHTSRCKKCHDRVYGKWDSSMV